MMLSHLYYSMSACLYSFRCTVWCLPTWMTSVYLYYFCLRVWCLPKVWCLSICNVSAPTCIVYMSVQLYNVCLPILPGYLYLKCLATFMKRCLPTCLVSAFLYDGCSVPRLHFCIVSSSLYAFCSTLLDDVRLLVWCILNVVMSARLCAVCSTIWCLPTYIISA